MIYFTDWRLDATGDILARQYDNESRTLTISGALPEGWTWDLLVRAGDAMDIWPLEAQEGGVGCTLTAEMLAVAGYYTIQLRGTQGEKVRHTNTLRIFIPESLSGDAHWPEIPTAFSDAVTQAEGAADRAEDAAQAAEDAAAHYPYPDPDTGTWWVWDPEKGEYTDSGEPYSGGGGGQGQDGGYYVPSVDANGVLTWTASKSGMPQVESANVKGTPGNAGYSPSAAVVETEDGAKITITDKDGTTEATVKNGTNGADGVTPTIGDNGNWYLESEDTGKPSRGPAGQDGAGMDITGATVGQIAKITAVDENGKPTAWTPVDMPSGGGGEWTKIIDVDVTEKTVAFKANNLNGATEFHIRWSNLQNESSSDSGLDVEINGIMIAAYACGAIVKKMGTGAYGWTHIKNDGLFWLLSRSGGALTATNLAASITNSVYNLVEDVGEASSIVLSAPTSTYAPVSGKLEVWTR